MVGENFYPLYPPLPYLLQSPVVKLLLDNEDTHTYIYICSVCLIEAVDCYGTVKFRFGSFSIHFDVSGISETVGNHSRAVGKQ